MCSPFSKFGTWRHTTTKLAGYSFGDAATRCGTILVSQAVLPESYFEGSGFGMLGALGAGTSILGASTLIVLGVLVSWLFKKLNISTTSATMAVIATNATTMEAPFPVVRVLFLANIYIFSLIQNLMTTARRECIRKVPWTVCNIRASCLR